MFRIFRKLRQSLLAQGRIGRYLSYAVGEIMLVVVGILIAVQINNWNEARKNKITERAFIEGLVTDLEQDLVLIERVNEYNELKLARFDSLLSFAGTDLNNMPDHNILYDFMRKTISNISVFRNQDRSLMKIANLGSGIIRQQVADSIAFFQQNLKRQKLQDESYVTAHTEARQIAQGLFKIYAFHNPEYYNREKKEISGKPFPRISSDVALQDQFFNAIYFAQGVTRNYLSKNHLAGHYEKTKRLIDFLVKEYELPENAPEDSH